MALLPPAKPKAMAAAMSTPLERGRDLYKSDLVIGGWYRERECRGFLVVRAAGASRLPAESKQLREQMSLRRTGASAMVSRNSWARMRPCGAQSMKRKQGGCCCVFVVETGPNSRFQSTAQRPEQIDPNARPTIFLPARCLPQPTHDQIHIKSLPVWASSSHV